MKNWIKVGKKLALVLAVLPAVLTISAMGSAVQAVCQAGSPGCVSSPGGSGSGSGPSQTPPSQTSSCNDTTDATGHVSQSQVSKCVQSTPIWHDIDLIVNFLSAGVGIVVTGVILVGGIQYIAAGGNPNALTAARQRITNALIALFVFLFIYAFLQWLIPGGIFK